MPKLIIILFFLCTSLLSFSQFQIRGNVEDENGRNLPNVLILVYSNNSTYVTDANGSFNIPSAIAVDTFSFSLKGFLRLIVEVDSREFSRILLKSIYSSSHRKFHLNSIIKDTNSRKDYWTYEHESYSNLVENPFVNTLISPVVTFSPNTNKASYSNIRRFLNMNERVPPDAVRIEEMLNYFNLNYTPPEEGNIFYCTSFLSRCPWNEANILLMINVCAQKVNLDKVPPSNLVFLVDASGSMDLPNKLPILKSGFRLLVKNLRAIDTVSIVTYGASVKVILEAVSGEEKDKITKAIESIDPDGETPGEAGIRAGYRIASRHFLKSGNNRIILATDGDFNVGKTSEKDLENLIGEQEQKGIYLTCLGVGIGNYKDSKLFSLAQKGNGNFAYLDNEQEAERVLMTELTETLFSVADNVNFYISLNPTLVTTYRLIGYDNRLEALRDTSSRVEGGVIGSGHSLTALFEISARDTSSDNQNIANVEIHYQLPGKSQEQKLSFNCPGKIINQDSVDINFKKAAGIAMLGMKLKESPYAYNISWKDLEIFAKKYFDNNGFFDKEVINIIDKAKKIYNRKKTEK